MMTTAIANSASVAARETLARRVLLRGRTTRLELSRETGLCAASVTNHTRWLLRQGFLTSTPIRLPSVNRSVDELSVNAGGGTALAIHVRNDRIETQVLGLNANVLGEFAAPVRAATQHAVLAAVCAAVEKALDWATGQGLRIDLAGMSVSGTVTSEDGIVFGIDGIPHWRPCQPQEVLPMLGRIPVLHVWTQVMSKMVGLSTLQGRDDRIGYVEFLGRTFHIASMRRGEVRFGRHGSTSAFLHVSVNDRGPVCYCGRRGCLADLLESDRPIDMHVLADTFIGFLRQVKVDSLGLEWQGERKWLEGKLAESGFTVYPVPSGREMALRGLGILTASSSLSRKLTDGHNGESRRGRKPARTV